MSQLDISNIEYLVIIGYLVLITFVGIVFKTFSSDTDDYFKSGSKGSWWLVGSSAFMSAFSAWTFTGAAGVAYESGFSVMIIFLGNAFGFFLNFLFLGPWLRQMRVTTFPEAISKRFGEPTRMFYALYEVPVRILYSAMALYGLGIFCSAVFGYNIFYVIILCGIIVLFYSATGGRWAVMATDFLQGLILVPLTIIIAWLCISKLGGIGSLFEQIEVQGLSEEFNMINSGMLFGGAYTWGWASAMVTKGFLVFNSMYAGPRYFSVKDGREARKAALLASALFLIGGLIWFLPPITARLLYAEDVMALDIAKPAEAAYAIASIKLLPVGLIGLIVVAILTATMSTMDTGLNTNVAILIKDIYPKLKSKFKWKEKSEPELLKYGRLYTFFMGVFILLLALYMAQAKGRGIFEIMLDVGALLMSPIQIPLMWGLFIRRTPSWAALLSIGCAFTVSLMAFLNVPLNVFGFAPDASWTFQMKFFGVLTAGSLGFLISIPFAPQKGSAHRTMVDQFITTMKMPINFKVEVGQGNDSAQLKVIGWFGAAIAVFIGLMLIIPNPLSGKLAIAALALIIGSVSAFMIRAGSSSEFKT
ncbi:sodium:solute symporter family transporter [Litorimonas sp. WD9-15]|uniref:sodium:solute symporter family transporter n=1 Tax=Litorimonas sp. WD9-15 TaxID=3418716 RepID=UPI003D062CBD